MYARTALVNNHYPSSKQLGLQPFIYRCRDCDTGMNSNNPATRYQLLKQIWGTVRVPSSLYTMNLAGLNVYERPNEEYKVVEQAGSPYIVSPGVNWNQMSDRRQPHIQKVVTASGSTYGGSSLKRSLVRLRPGAMSPGGSGVDIKHNSYDRYLNRIKGKAPLKRGPIPPYFASPYIPFNRAAPIYGSKLVKTSIINNCVCRPEDKESQNKIIFGSGGYPEFEEIVYQFGVGQVVLARRDTFYKKAIIVTIEGNLITVQFAADGLTATLPQSEIKIYSKECECVTSDEKLLSADGKECILLQNDILNVITQ